MNARGLEEGLRGPSTFRLAFNILGFNPSELVIVEASDQQKREAMSLFMPKDKLVMIFDCRGTFSIASDAQHAEAIFSRLPSTPIGGYTSKIDFDDVYSVYAQQIIWTTCRAILVKYDIEHVMAHREAISAELEKAIDKRLEGTPIKLVHFGLSSVQPPELILEAQKVSKQREVEIDQAKADRLVKLKEAEGELEVAKKQQQVDLLQADTQRQVGLRLTKGVNHAFVQQRVLSSLEKLSASKDKVIIVPDAALQNGPLMTAIHQDTFGAKESNK
jgi:regulator of protease activity HflC (stomatin/prohibitin superfamily)